MMADYFNPYSDQDFFGFFFVFVKRAGQFLCGRIGWDSLAADEVQMGVLICLALSGSLVGTFLVLRRMTMLANALSHTILLGIVAAYLLFHSSPNESLSLPLLGFASLLSGVLTTAFTESLSGTTKLQEDASIGLVFTFLFALGVLFVTLFTRNVHVGTELVMGNADALQRSDLILVASVLAGNLLLVFLFFKELNISTFDRNLSRILGFSPLFFNYLLMVQTAGTVVSAFKAVGVVMILAFLVIPPLAARLLVTRLPAMILTASFLGGSASLVGVALSRHVLTRFQVGLSTGGLVVCVLAAQFFISLFFKKFWDGRVALTGLARFSHQHSDQFGQAVLSDAEENPEGKVKLTLPRDALKVDDETAWPKRPNGW